MTTQDQAPPTESFDRYFFDSECPAIDCELCGITHYDQSGKGMTVEEIGEMKFRYATIPEKVQFHDEPVRWGVLGDKQIVMGCRCNRVSDYEKMFWENRYKLLCYIAFRMASGSPESACFSGFNATARNLAGN